MARTKAAVVSPTISKDQEGTPVLETKPGQLPEAEVTENPETKPATPSDLPESDPETKPAEDQETKPIVPPPGEQLPGTVEWNSSSKYSKETALHGSGLLNRTTQFAHWVEEVSPTEYQIKSSNPEW